MTLVAMSLYFYIDTWDFVSHEKKPPARDFELFLVFSQPHARGTASIVFLVIAISSSGRHGNSWPISNQITVVGPVKCVVCN